MKVIIICICALVLAVLMLFLYSCLVIASKSDQSFNEEDNKNGKKIL